MQRQSLGSPSPKLASKDEQYPSHIQYSSSLFHEEEEEDDGEEAAKKMMNHKTNAIHLIPILTLLCFLILYLSSHHLSPHDLAQFNISKTLSNPRELQGIIKGDILAIRSLKNLEQEAAGRAKHRLLHRKFAPF